MIREWTLGGVWVGVVFRGGGGGGGGEGQGGGLNYWTYKTKPEKM